MKPKLFLMLSALVLPITAMAQEEAAIVNNYKTMIVRLAEVEAYFAA